MIQTNNVVTLHTNRVYDDIITFIKKFESKHTRSNYERNIRNFFLWLPINKKIEHLNVDDIQVRNADIIRYQTYLKEHEADYANITINNYIAAIQSLYEFFEINEYPVNSKHTKVDSLSDDVEHAGALYLNEAEEMARLIMNDRKQGQEKSAFIRMAYTTSFRKSSLRALEWGDIKLNPNGNHYLVTTVGKGNKKHTMPISVDLYNELLKIKEKPYYKKYNDNKIFHLSPTTIQSMMKRLKDQMGILPERNVKFHSLRNVAAGFGTLEEAKKHLNHSSIATTQIYRSHATEDYSNSISLRLEEKIDDNIFKELTKDQLIQLILNQGYGTITQMKKEAQEMLISKSES
ncbi:tyrosine-type recombinase/integrase [Paenibacillus illinoisensis]|uniref:SPBc2 prophage-derived probable integrase-recombinase YopP n=1 Tax=Paenibacillus illinoisensis TaxID=59845 RepID=A0A2W0CKI5_9BACL|nr:site-specific integrase [Paenibacillus illinoisensis]PYY28338.1 SPBc2 prophage-derived probable integrase-recombinase YopP [Paenibacillus illinoisensis]